MENSADIKARAEEIARKKESALKQEAHEVRKMQLDLERLWMTSGAPESRRGARMR